LQESVNPQLINLSNILIAGCAPRLKAVLGVPLLVTLQGDDVFLDELAEPSRSQALKQIQCLIESIDGFLVHSTYYADYMSDYLGIPRERFHQVKLGIATADFQSMDNTGSSSEATVKDVSRQPTIGYLARLAPEKGLHVLCEAFIELRKRPATSNARLRIAGWMGPAHRDYVQQTLRRLDEAGCSDAYLYEGEVNREEKIRFLHGIDVLSVPTIYREPKGLYVLEALAAGVPVVQPRHGAFPEILAETGGGRLFSPGDTRELADTLYEVLNDHEARNTMSRNGQRVVHESFTAEAMAQSTWEAYRKFVQPG
jgi:glycosyltransferase involved in cell wall biosynthesis